MTASSMNITDAQKPEYDFPSRSPMAYDRRLHTKDAQTAAAAAMSRTWTGAGGAQSELHTFDVTSRVGFHGGHGAGFAARAARERERGRPRKHGPGYEEEEE